MAEFEVYQDTSGDFRWRFLSNSGRILAVSGEGYNNRANCTHAIILIKRETPQAAIKETDLPAPATAGKQG